MSEQTGAAKIRRDDPAPPQTDRELAEFDRLLERVPVGGTRGYYLIETGRSWAIRDPRHRCVTPYIREWDGCETVARYMVAAANLAPTMRAVEGQLRDALQDKRRDAAAELSRLRSLLGRAAEALDLEGGNDELAAECRSAAEGEGPER